MPRFYDKLSDPQKFWLGFACCPLITFIGVVLFVLVLIFVGPSMSRIMDHLSGNWSYLPLAFAGLSGLIYLSAIPLLCGFIAAFFWRHLSCYQNSENSAYFWSVVLAWWPLLIYPPAIPLFLLPFLIFLTLYNTGMNRGAEFWDSNRPRQWMGDFSDFGPRDER